MNGLRNQVEATAAQGLSGSGDTQALFSALENQANNLLKQLEASERDRSLIAFGRELLPLAKWSMGFDRKNFSNNSAKFHGAKAYRRAYRGE